MEVLIILALLVLNGFFAMCEIALVASSRSRLDQQAKKGVRGAKIAQELLKEPEKFLSTVQIGITLVGILAGAYGAEAFAGELQPFFERIEFFSNYAEEISFGLIITVITYFSLIIGELVPKSIALNNPEKITVFFAPFMKVLARVAYPLVAFLSLSTRVFRSLLFIKENKKPPVTEEELKYMIETGSRYGIIEKNESELLYGVFNFGDRIANNIMTLKKDIVWIDINKSRQEILAQVLRCSFTKYPVCDGSFNKILGVISVSEILKYASSESFDLRKHLIEPLFYSGVTPAHRILEEFRAKKIHTGFVVNEYGETKGLITLHDLIENIIGDIPEGKEVTESPVVKRDDGSWLMNGDLRVEEFSKLLGIQRLPSGRYTTLAGFMIYRLASLPAIGTSFVYDRYRFEVVDMDGNRIDKVLITPV